MKPIDPIGKCKIVLDKSNPANKISARDPKMRFAVDFEFLATAIDYIATIPVGTPVYVCYVDIPGRIDFKFYPKITKSKWLISSYNAYPFSTETERWIFVQLPQPVSKVVGFWVNEKDVEKVLK